MKNEIEVTKIETKITADSVAVMYEIKTPYTHTDDYGNSEIFYKKEIISEDDLMNRKEILEKELEEVSGKLIEIDKVK